VIEVIEDSVAEAAGIRAGDIILAAAGFETATTGKLIEIVQRQAPGTWLPLRLSRDGEVLTPTARFPQSFE
jgi:S1-C subfamily serine protease